MPPHGQASQSTKGFQALSEVEGQRLPTEGRGRFIHEHAQTPTHPGLSETLEGHYTEGILQAHKGTQTRKIGYICPPLPTGWGEKVQSREGRRCLSGLQIPWTKPVKPKQGVTGKTMFDKTAGKLYANVKLMRKGGGEGQK